MAEEPDSIVLHYLRRFDERQARFEDTLHDLRAELSALRNHLVTIHGDLAAIAHREDAQGRELARIKRRLDLGDNPDEAR